MSPRNSDRTQSVLRRARRQANTRNVTNSSAMRKRAAGSTRLDWICWASRILNVRPLKKIKNQSQWYHLKDLSRTRELRMNSVQMRGRMIAAKGATNTRTNTEVFGREIMTKLAMRPIAPKIATSQYQRSFTIPVYALLLENRSPLQPRNCSRIGVSASGPVGYLKRSNSLPA